MKPQLKVSDPHLKVADLWLQGGHSPEKPGKVREFQSVQGKAIGN